MAARSIFIQFLFLFSMMCLQTGYGQCTSCSTLVTNNSVASYTVTSGQTLCIFANLTYTGSITLSGGTVCNNGIIQTLIVHSGTFNNNFQGQVLAASKSDLVFNLDGNAVFNNFSQSRVELSDSLNIKGGTFDTLYLNIHKSSWMSCNDLSQFSGNLMIDLGGAETSDLVTDTVATVNINGTLLSRKDLGIHIREKGLLNANGAIYLQDKGLKTLNNHGVVNSLGDLQITGDGDSEGSITLNNYGEFYTLMITASIINATLSINNYQENARSVLYVPFSSNLSPGAASYLNAGVTLFDGGLTLGAGNFTNSHYLETSALSISGATLTNEGILLVNSGGFAVLSGVLNNDSIITVNGLFQNHSVTNLGNRSMLACNDFENGSGGEINGPASASDLADYGKIIIQDNSSNYGRITRWTAFHDFSATGGDGTLDYLDAAGEIGENVVFSLNCENSDNVLPGFLMTETPQKGTRTNFCYGETILYKFYPLIPPGAALSWTFTGTCGAVTVLSPDVLEIQGVTGSGIVSISSIYYFSADACPFTLNLPVNVINGTITTTSPLHFGAGNPVYLTSTVTTGVPPIQYTWTPNVFFASPSTNGQPNPTVMPQVSMVYTVTMRDAYGCTGSNTVEVIGEPFASLDKELNGEYYKLFDNQLFFRHEGQYDQSSFRYYVYDKSHTVVASPSQNNIVNFLNIKPGDNRLTLNASSLTTGYYVLEVINEKNEKTYLRFQR